MDKGGNGSDLAPLNDKERLEWCNKLYAFYNGKMCPDCAQNKIDQYGVCPYDFRYWTQCIDMSTARGRYEFLPVLRN